MSGTRNSGRRPHYPKLESTAFGVPATHFALVRAAAAARGAALATVERDVFWVGLVARRLVARAVDALREVAAGEGLEAEGQLLVLTEPRRRRAELAEALFAFYADAVLGRDPAAWKLETENATPADRQSWQRELAAGVAKRCLAAESLLRGDLGRVEPARTVSEAFAGALDGARLDEELDEELDGRTSAQPVLTEREAALEARLTAAELEVADLRSELRRRKTALDDALVEAVRAAGDDLVGHGVVEALERVLARTGLLETV